MSFVSSTGLEWAVRRLTDWAEQATARRAHQRLLRLFILKRLDVPLGVGERTLTTADFQNACAAHFKVSFEEDGTQEATGGTPQYFDPFSPRQKYKSAAPGSDLAVGTLWTRVTWERMGLLGRRRDGNAHHFSFPPDYPRRLRDDLRRTVPLLPTAIYTMRTPSQAAHPGFDAATVTDRATLITAFQNLFHLSNDELFTLFHDGDDEPPSGWLAAAELSRAQALASIQSVVPFQFEQGENEADVLTEAEVRPAGVVATDAEEVSEQITLIGVDDAVSRTLAALSAGMHVILVGPPGTGKTTIAKAAAAAAAGKGESSGGYASHTATGDWTTFETIGGYMPRSAHELHFVPGVVVEAIKADRWLIIDEINRADIDKAFGELFTLLTTGETRLSFGQTPGGPRIEIVSERTAARRPLLEHQVVIRNHWRLIGTMNSLDKASLHQLSYAFMRRFAFIEVRPPKPDDYTAILVEGFNAVRANPAFAESPEVTAFLESTQRFFERAFTADGGFVDDLALGAGIPLAMIRYTHARCDYFRSPPPASAAEVFVEACEALLLPQYEGRRSLHPRVVAALEAAMSTDASQSLLGRLGSSLKLWSGDGV